MDTTAQFDDIRPFYDSEIPAAMQRIAESPHFPLLAQYVYPGADLEKVKQLLVQFKTVRDFQLEVMRCVNEQVIARSITDFTYDGIERLDPEKRYLFVSNHRDIMLDACLLQYVLWKNGHETTEITFGANLMSSPLVIDIGKSNKMFRVERGGTPREFYRSSMHLSQYIRHCITEKHQSVWIAQRNGRTKDGIDQTDQGIIKMFGMSMAKQPVQALAELNIVPVSISYEWESCDLLKARELYLSQGTKYVKQPGEDLNSILTGVLQPKGCVHISFCEPVTAADLEPLAADVNSEFNRAVARLLDKRITSAYHLTPNNYIAYDLLHCTSKYADRYTAAQRDAFLAHTEKLSNLHIDDLCTINAMRSILWGIYANPIDNVVTE
ncbi:MAG: 1-acyl-sn-glycerol-3-phosphate acyltransferase [Bacteroidales bacterium]|nr:1-acyl-sn-glycerol-3-phosphate acyltransferase [Bacteroidales bacterium]